MEARYQYMKVTRERLRQQGLSEAEASWALHELMAVWEMTNGDGDGGSR